MSHTRMSHGTHKNESKMSHVTHQNESCHTQEWVTSHTGMSHVTLDWARTSRHTWKFHKLIMSHVTHRNESCHTEMSHVTHENASHERMSHVSQLIPKAAMVRMQHKRKKNYLICIPFILLVRISNITRTKETRHTKVCRT